MDECIQVKQSWEADTILDEEGPLDEGGDFPECEPAHRRIDSGSSNSAAWSTGADAGSPMDIENHRATLL